MKITTFEEACQAKNLDPVTVLPNVSMFPVQHQAAIIAYAKLIIITEVITDGWKPNWNDNEYKYYPWFDLEVEPNNPSGFRFGAAICDSSYTGTAGGSRLCYRTRREAEYVGKTFVDLFRDMMVLPQ